MKLLRPRTSAPERRGVALLMAFLVLMVLVVLAGQISISTHTDARQGRNELEGTKMELAIESSLLECFEQLKTDGEADAQAANSQGGAGGGGAGGGGGGLPGPQMSGGMGEDGGSRGGGSPFGGGGGGGGGEDGPTDSREDDWAHPQRTEINEIQLRVLIQDEDSKLNVLGMLTENEEEREKAFERVVRVIDLFREGTLWDIDPSSAREMAEAMREYLERRDQASVPRPVLLTDLDEQGRLTERGMPLTLREVVVLEEAFDETLFRDFRDEEGNVVHSLGSFLTVWTSVKTIEEFREIQKEQAAAASGKDEEEEEQSGVAADETSGAQGSGGVAGTRSVGQGGQEVDGPQFGGGQADEQNEEWGIAVNVNTAPAAVLFALMDERDVPPNFWDDVIEYRNLEDEEARDADAEPVYDEFGEEVIVRQVFQSDDTFRDIYGWEGLEPIVQAELRNLLTQRSQVFSIYVTARKSTSAEEDWGGVWDAREARERDEDLSSALLRTVRCVIWRRQNEDGEVEIVPLQRWEVIDYVPYEVRDYPEEERY